MAAGAVRAVTTAGELPDGLHGYVVATPAGVHLQNIAELLPRRCPIFVEKPLANDIPAALALGDDPLARDIVFVMHKWRYHPGIVALAALIDSKTLGEVLGLRLQRTNWAPMHEGVDCALQLLPHDLSIALHLLGHLPPVERVVPNPVGSPETGLYVSMADRAAGRRVTIEANNLIPGNIRACSVGFEQGVAQVSSLSQGKMELRRQDRPEAPEHIALPSEMPLFNELRAFAGYLSGGPRPLSPLSDELLILRHIDEIQGHLYGGAT